MKPGLLRFAALWLLLLALLAMSGAANGQSPATTTPQKAISTLTIRIVGLRNAKGNIFLKLNRDSNTVETRRVEIDAKTLTAQTLFENLPYGVYAVSLIHDENKNGKLDTNFFGIPVEGYGFSNNPAKRAGMPMQKEMEFALNQAQQAIEIRVIYW